MIDRALVRELQAHIDMAERTGERTTAWEFIQERLLERGIAQKNLQASSEFVGVSTFNRSKFGVGGIEAQVHGSDILQQGTATHRHRAPFAHMSPPPPHDEEARKRNRYLEERSTGLVPPLVDLKYESIGGSHTNTFVRQVNGGVRAVVEQLKRTAVAVQGRPRERHALVCASFGLRCLRP